MKINCGWPDHLGVFWQWIVGDSPAPLPQGTKIVVRQNVGTKTCLDASTHYFNSTSVFSRSMAMIFIFGLAKKDEK